MNLISHEYESSAVTSASAVPFDERPFIVIWEMTRACDLACLHCRASAQSLRSPQELSTLEGERLIGEVAEMGVPVFILTGGDPLKRSDTSQLVGFAARLRLPVSLAPSATPLLTREAIAQLGRQGLARLALSLDGAEPEVHDAIRGVQGSFQRTLNAAGWARESGLSLQINTTVTRRNLDEIPALIPLLESMDIVMWSVFIMVPTGRGQRSDLITADQCEELFGLMYAASRRVPFHVKTTEGMHYRRYLLQQHAKEQRGQPATGSPAETKKALDSIGRAPRGLNDAKGFVFVSHTGDVYPSGFFPSVAGNIRQQSLSEIYRHSPLFIALRDPDRLKGKCGRCEFRNICGGSRARAFTMTGDAFAEDPLCVYQPQPLRPSVSAP
ncbi:MAG TPA: TIGR04053 family radical SAM/SPASM domain-containing protein [Terriglobia bacterium]|nr:TIGR04053 family radical SAM/SPASM domain-containing protein [Terriglobia bacterium]